MQVCEGETRPARYGMGEALGPAGGDEGNLQKHAMLDGNSRGTVVRATQGQFRG